MKDLNIHCFAANLEGKNVRFYHMLRHQWQEGNGISCFSRYAEVGGRLGGSAMFAWIQFDVLYVCFAQAEYPLAAGAGLSHPVAWTQKPHDVF